ncbi:hypothetical protein N7509_006475 [Penicillium cosmopolitanum]|uniref:Zn(2)-C6 fungal-type domain-containing protein n=1 Tax=Penicillium cosmopolitanum TaxID=1131564 RepID=A0A9W9W0H4_9EURO|nr:uncharacterized protein N7509_006475 [Penicillium cosmopolitanum]KAJ5394688.1 hypothetical protein N7509_006475 [Penicillium cosmopolitanum]
MEHAAHEECWTCRRRRVQCDKCGIPCLKCQNAGLDCLDKRPIRWVQGVAIRGKMQGRSFGGSPATISIRPQCPKFVGKVSRSCGFRALFDVQPSSASFNPSIGNIKSHTDGLISLPNEMQDPILKDLNPTSQGYIVYYHERICKLLMIRDSPENPFRKLVPLCLQHSLLQKAMLALAARHFANTFRAFSTPAGGNIPGFHRANHTAFLFKHQAIEELSFSLQNPDRSDVNITLASIFLLIILDLFESGNDSWETHLEGAKTLIASNRALLDTEAADSDKIVTGVMEYILKQIHIFALQTHWLIDSRIEVLGATFSRYGSSRAQRAEKTLGQVFVGCPVVLAQGIGFLSAERDIICRLESFEAASVQAHKSYITSTLELIQNFDSLSRSRRAFLSCENAICTFSLIYGQRLLRTLMQETRPLNVDLIDDLLRTLGSLRSDLDLFKCALWPIFIAGLECSSESQRAFLSECLEEFWLETHCVNVINAAIILQNYWQQKDHANWTNWMFGIGSSSRAWLLI